MLAFLLYHRYGLVVLRAVAIACLAVLVIVQVASIHPLILAAAVLAAVRRTSPALIRT